jgi:uncharacterized protein YoxC
MLILIIAAIAVAFSIWVNSNFGRQVEEIKQLLGRLEAELHVLKHEEAHRNTETVKLHTKSSTVADDVEYTWEKYARKHLKKGWK